VPLSRSSTHAAVLLVVDDEPIVLNCVASVLECAGFAVLRAASGEEALRIAADRRGPIDLTLSDVVLPGLSGPSLIERFSEWHPETQWIFMAGLPDHPEVLERVSGRHAFLAKPFMPKVLINKVEEVLAAAGDRALAAGA